MSNENQGQPAPPSRPTLTPAHRDHIYDKYGLSDDTMKGALLASVDRQVAAKILLRGAQKLPASGIEIPYPNGFSRIRWDTPRVTSDGEDAKYDHPIGVAPRPYDPEFKRFLVHEQSLPLYLPEGEFKALVLREVGLAAVGIPGVNNLHDVELRKESGGETWALHPDLKRLIPAGRSVVLPWDADIDTNERV
jgi:hypothetical protein